MSSESLTQLNGLAAASSPPRQGSFLEPQALIVASGARRFVPPAWPVLPIALGLILGSTALDNGQGSYGAQALLVVGLVALWVIHFTIRRSVSRAMDAEISAVSTLEELIQLRRWPEAANLAEQVLSRPMYLRERRLAGLVGLATLLTRYHRFEDARVVHEYLLSGTDGFVPDASTAHSIRVAKAMGMLREDHLVDADKAMAELRREVNRARDEVRRDRGSDAAKEVQSAGLALLELYRDVKTRHYEEACEGFDRALPILRDQLGLRVADAWLLVAAARHGLGRTEDARLAYENATTLAPALELHRRYPEAAPLAQTFASAHWPTKVGRQ